MIYRCVVGLSGKGLIYLKQVVDGLIFDFCVWRKSGWEGRIHLVNPIGSLMEISHITWFPKTKTKLVIVTNTAYSTQ